METYTICVIGDSGVGKTALISAISQDTCAYASPLNVFVSLFQNKTIEWWDFSGAEKHKSLRLMFYKYFDGYVFVHDLSNSKTYRNLKRWKKELRPWIADSFGQLKDEIFPTLIVGNKLDMAKVESEDKQIGHSSASSTLGVFETEDWNNFLSKVISNENKGKLERANRQIEEQNDEIETEDTLMGKIKNWFKPQDLPTLTRNN